MRLIDADELKQRIAFRMWDVDDDCPHDEATIRISEDWAIDALVDKQPTVEAVPVVRCKDCKYYTFGECNFWNHRGESTRPLVYEDDFCSRGERKDDETD